MNIRLLLITLFCILLSLGYLPIVFDDSYDCAYANFSRFQFSDFSLFDYHYLLMVLKNSLYKYLQNSFPSISVFPLLYLLSNIFSFIYCIHTLLKVDTRGKNLVFFLVFVSLHVLLLENIISITHTRYATIIAGTALINIFLLYKQTKHILLHYVFFVFAFLSRPESAMGAYLVLFVAYFIFSPKLIPAVKKSIFPIALFFLFFLSLSIHKLYTNRLEIKIEPDIEYALSTQRVIPLATMDNYKDSVRYEMSMNGVFIDTSFINIDFLNKLKVNKILVDFEKLKQSASNVLFFYGYYAIFSFMFLIYLLLLLFYYKKYFFALKLFSFQLFIFSLLSYLDYNVRLADRHFIGMQLLTFFITSMYLFAIKTQKKPNAWFKMLALIGLVVSAKITLSNSIGNQYQVEKEVDCYVEVMLDFEKFYKGRTVIATNSTIHLFDRNFSFFNDNYKANKYLMYDMVTVSIVPRYQQYLSKICNCNSYEPLEFFIWMSENDVIFMTNKQRSEIIEKYMLVNYGVEMHFMDDPNVNKLTQPSCMEHSIYNDYEFKIITFESN